jgi:hypothetical protein
VLAESRILPDSILIGLDKYTVSRDAAVEALDNGLQHLKGNTTNLGKIAVLLTSDFPPKHINIRLWSKIQKSYPRTNIRVHH